MEPTDPPVNDPATDSATAPTAPAVIDTTPTTEPTIDTTPLEQRVIEEFEKRSAEEAPELPAALSSDVPTVDPTAPPTPPAPDAQGQGEPLPPADPTPVDPTAPPAPPEPVVTWGEHSFTDDDMRTLTGLREWASGLDDTAISTVEAALSGDYILVPIADAPAIQRFYQSQGQPVTQATAPTQAPEFDSNFEPVDPTIAQIQQQVGQLTEAHLREQERAQLAQVRNEINTSADAYFAARTDLTPEDRARLDDQVIQSGMFATLSAQYPPAQAIAMAYDRIAASDPVLIQRQIDAKVAEQFAALQAQQQQMAGSTALSGSSAPATPGQVAPQNPEDAYVAAIARALENS